MKNYIIGYGSLINTESQNITGRTLSSQPVILQGYSRSWSVIYDDLQFCALGIYQNKSSQINVVLFEVENLQVFDQREHGYTRVELDRNLLKVWNQNEKIPATGKIWIYLPYEEKFGKPSEKHFIWQSYIDVILMGCLSVDDKFAQEFMKTTTGYRPEFLKEDRRDSAYLKALKTYNPETVEQILADARQD